MGWILGLGNGVVFRTGSSMAWSSYWLTRTPSGLIVIVKSSTEISGSFTINGTGQDGHQVFISSDNNSFTLLETLIGSDNTFEATGLNNDTTYYFKVRAYKGTNYSPYSNIDSEKTFELWYLAGGVDATNCIAAYQPIGAASLAASKVNMINPETNDAGGGTDPDWDAVNGWKFNGTSHYLKTGIVPENDQTWSMIVRFTEWTTGADTICGVWEGASKKEFYIQTNGDTNQVICGNGNHQPVAPALSSGIIAVAGNKIYINGKESGSPIGGGTGSITYDIWIGQVHYASPANFFDGNIQVLAIYNKVLSAAEQLALRYRMTYITDPVNIRLMQNYVANGFGALICWNMPTFTELEQANPDISIDTFAPTGLDIDNWLDTCVLAGMKYAILTVKHHDGFKLWFSTSKVGANPVYGSQSTAWYAANGNPDITELFVAGCRSRGLKIGIYYSIWDTTWETQTGSDETSDAAGYIAMIEAELTELLTNYGNVDSLWFDGWGWHLGYEEINYNTIYNFVKGIQPRCVIVENSQTHPAITSQIETYEVPVDSVIPAGNLRLCEEVNTIRNDGHWFFHALHDQSDAAFTAAATIKAAIDNANDNNGAYLLAVTPGTDGHLPAAQVTRLAEIGAL